ncbi:MAG: DUF296 domain-containing protein [Candidatus Bathyarchaeia archaeon]
MLEGKIGRIIFSRILEDEDLADAIKQRAEKSGVKAGLITVIGSLKTAVLGYYKEGEYKHIRLDGPLEIASCAGNIAVDEKGGTVIHAHIVVTDEDGKAFGGHLMQGSVVGVTAELAIIEGVGLNLQRIFDGKTKLKLLRLS